jgi:hypothetical protein
MTKYGLAAIFYIAYLGVAYAVSSITSVSLFDCVALMALSFIALKHAEDIL